MMVESYEVLVAKLAQGFVVGVGVAVCPGVGVRVGVGVGVLVGVAVGFRYATVRSVDEGEACGAACGVV